MEVGLSTQMIKITRGSNHRKSFSFITTKNMVKKKNNFRNYRYGKKLLTYSRIPKIWDNDV